MAHAQTGGDIALRQAGPLPQGQHSVGEIVVADLVVTAGRDLHGATLSPKVRHAD
jgi:hypothetical protein